MALLELTQITKTYRAGQAGEVRALPPVSLALAAGEFVAVQGPSGCGKTTLLLIAGGLLAPTAGRVVLAQEEPYAMSADRRAEFRARHLGFVFQQFHLVPYLSVLDNVLAPALAAAVPDARARAEELVAQFGLQARRRHVPGELSTGERQRTALARALLNRPKVLLADEPTGNLDRENADVVLDHLGKFARAGGAVLLVTHEEHAAQRADRVLRLPGREPQPASCGRTEGL
jgi:putative ABC transport system ATP-binding protein